MIIIRILIADDQRINRRILANMLLDLSYELIEAENGRQALEILTQPNAPQIALIDWEMPLLDGLEVCRQLRAKERDTLDYTFILLVTGHASKENVAEGFAAGADDYLLKPFDRNILYMRLTVAQRIVSLQNHLIHLATKDGLTGLLNRRTIMGRLQGYINEQGFYPLTIGILDIDHFKHVNDNFGHQAGDEVLAESARRMLASIPENALVGRMGGEEFILIFPRADAVMAVQLCETVRKSLAEQAIHVGGLTLNITASIGFAVAVKPALLDDLLHVADTAMYIAKHSGRNCVSGG